MVTAIMAITPEISVESAAQCFKKANLELRSPDCQYIFFLVEEEDREARLTGSFLGSIFSFEKRMKGLAKI
jgi:hypothetical protein